MPTQVWKCDHCLTSSPDKLIIDTHEKTCVFNPRNMKCESCLHYTLVNKWDDNYSCDIPLKVKDLDIEGIDNWHDMEDREQGCPLWEKDE